MTDINHSEPSGATSSSATAQNESEAALTAGQLIRAKRIQLGVHLAVLSLQLKLPQRQLEALEADRHDVVKGPAFVRALAASVCRQLRMDPAPVLALLPQSSMQLPVQRHAIGELLSEQPTLSNQGISLRTVHYRTLAVAALMLGLIAALLWMPSPSTWSWLQAAPETAAAVSPPTSLPDVLPPSPPLQTDLAEPAPALPPRSATVSTPPSPVMRAQPSTGPAFVFTAHADSWIEIRDAKDRVLWSRLLQAGEKNEVQYPLPVRVVVGRSNAVTVTFRGQPFDLAPHTKVSVARFEVKE